MKLWNLLNYVFSNNTSCFTESNKFIVIKNKYTYKNTGGERVHVKSEAKCFYTENHYFIIQGIGDNQRIEKVYNSNVLFNLK